MFAPNVHGVSRIVSHVPPDDSSMSGSVFVRSIGWNLEGSDGALEVLAGEVVSSLNEAAVPGSIGEGDILKGMLRLRSACIYVGRLERKVTKDSGSWRGFSAVFPNDEFGGV